MKDFIGRWFVRGQYVVYPGRRGSSLWMNLGHLLAVKLAGKCSACDGTGARTPMQRVDGSAPCLSCMGSGHSHIEYLEVQPVSATAPRRPLGKPVRLRCTDKVTVVDLPNLDTL